MAPYIPSSTHCCHCLLLVHTTNTGLILCGVSGNADWLWYIHSLHLLCYIHSLLLQECSDWYLRPRQHLLQSSFAAALHAGCAARRAGQQAAHNASAQTYKELRHWCTPEGFFYCRYLP